MHKPQQSNYPSWTHISLRIQIQYKCNRRVSNVDGRKTLVELLRSFGFLSETLLVQFLKEDQRVVVEANDGTAVVGAVNLLDIVLLLVDIQKLLDEGDFVHI